MNAAKSFALLGHSTMCQWLSEEAEVDNLGHVLKLAAEPPQAI